MKDVWMAPQQDTTRLHRVIISRWDAGWFLSLTKGKSEACNFDQLNIASKNRIRKTMPSKLDLDSGI